MRPFLTHLFQRGRHFSISQSPSLTAKHGIYVSHSSDPYFNLSFEDWYALRSRIFIYAASNECMNAGAQAVQGEAGPGATPAHLSRQTMRHHRTKPKPLERSELSCFTSRWRSLHTPAQWGRNRVPCTSCLCLDLIQYLPMISHGSYELN